MYNKIVIAALTVLALGATVRVEGTAACPEPVAIATRLTPLLNEGSAEAHVARVDDSSAGLRLELHRADGSLIQSRVLPRSDSCDALAETAAVVIAAWESDLAAREPPPPRFAAPEPRHDAPTPAVVEPVPQWSLGAAFVASIVDGDLTPGGMADVSFVPSGHALGVRASVTGTASRQITLGMGSASWTRVAFAAGPRYAVPWKRAQIDLHAELVAGILMLNGQGFRMTSSDTGFDPAIGGGIRFGGSRSSLSPWLDFGVIGWLQQDDVKAANPEVSAGLPRLELLFSAGISLGL